MSKTRSKLLQLEARTECGYQLLEEAAAQHTQTQLAFAKLDEKEPETRLTFDCFLVDRPGNDALIDEQQVQQRTELCLTLDNDEEWVSQV
jgi:hypothetical protein